MNKYEVSALKKGLQILDLLRINRSLTLKEIYEELQMNKTTAYRLVITLENMGYITKKGRSIELGNKMSLSPSIETPIDWTSLQCPYNLGRHTGEEVYIGTLNGTELTMQQMIKHPFEKPYQPEIGKLSPAHQSAIGKVILAHLEQEEYKDLFPQLPLTQATEQTFTDKELFLHHLNVIKSQGYSIDDEEGFTDIRCIAAPVFYGDQVIAGIAIAGSGKRIKKSLIRGLTNKVIAASNEITKEISLSD